MLSGMYHSSLWSLCRLQYVCMYSINWNTWWKPLCVSHHQERHAHLQTSQSQNCMFVILKIYACHIFLSWASTILQLLYLKFKRLTTRKHFPLNFYLFGYPFFLPSTLQMPWDIYFYAPDNSYPFVAESILESIHSETVKKNTSKCVNCIFHSATPWERVKSASRTEQLTKLEWKCWFCCPVGAVLGK